MKEKTRNFIKKFLIIEIAVIIGVIIIDQISKVLVTSILLNDSLYLSEGKVPAIPYLFNFTYVENKGAAFGSMEGQLIFFIILTIIAVGVFGFVMYKLDNKNKVGKIMLAVIIGGAIGNFIDRVFLGYVRDFIQFAFWEGFAIFNIADVALVLGTIAFAFYYLLFYKGKDKNYSAVENAQNDADCKNEMCDSENLPAYDKIENVEDKKNGIQKEDNILK